MAGNEVEIDVKANDHASRVFSAIGSSAMGLAKGLGGIAGAAGAVNVIAGLGSFAAAASGSLLLLPAAAGAVTLAVKAVSIGMQGFGDAMAATGEDAATFEAAIADLAPAAQATARAVRELRPAWDDMQLDVQERLFSNLAPIMSRLGSTYLPILGNGFGRVADAANIAAQRVGNMLTSDARIADSTTMVDNFAQVWEQLFPALGPVSAALMDIGTVGSSFLPGLTAGAGEAAASFQQFIAHARETGQLQEWISGGLSAIGDLAQLIGNLGAIAYEVFSGLSAQGAGLIPTLTTLTDGVLEFLRSFEGQQALAALGQMLSDVSGTVSGVLSAALRAVGPVIVALAPVISSLADAFGGLLLPILPVVGELLTAVATALQPIAAAVVPLASAIGDLLAAALGAVLALIQPLLPVIVELATMLAGILTQAVTALAPVLQQLAPVFGELGAALGGVLLAALQALMPLFQGLMPIFTTIAQTVATALVGAFQALVPVIEQLTPIIADVAALVGDALLTVLQAVAPLLPEIATAFVSIVEAVLPLLPPILQLATSLLPILTGALQLVIPFIVGMMQAVLRTIPALAGFIGGVVSLIAPIISTFATIQRSIATAISTVLGILGGLVTRGMNLFLDFQSRVIGIVSGFGRQLFSSGRAIVDNFLDGIRGAWGRITSWVSGAMANLRGLWPFSPAKWGPFSGSGYVTHSGEALTSDFAASLRAGMPGVLASARDLMGAVSGELLTPDLAAGVSLQRIVDPALLAPTGAASGAAGVGGPGGAAGAAGAGVVRVELVVPGGGDVATQGLADLIMWMARTGKLQLRPVP